MTRHVRRDKEVLPVKLYYRIGEVAGLVGVEPHVLRYWESEFPTIRPQKSRSGQRVYSRRDVETLMRVKDLLYAQRFTIAGARQRLRPGSGELSTAEIATRGAPEFSAETSAAVLEPPRRSDGSIHADAQRLRSALLTLRARIVGLLESVDASRANDEPIR